jgi:hypothetical protein
LAVYELAAAARIGSHLVNEDTSLLWVAARDWVHRRVGQPNFYGQSYGSTLESIPIAFLHAVRVPYWTATPAVLAGIEWLGWAVLAWAAWWRGRRVMAAAAFATPILLAAYHTVYVAIVPDSPMPRLIATGGAALLIAEPQRRRWLATAALMLGVGLQFDASAALFALPVFAWWLTVSHRSRAQLQALAAGAVAPLVLLVLTRVFYVRHPDYAFHPAPSLRPSASTLATSSRHLGDLFGLYAPELWRAWWIPCAVLVVLVVALIATRRVAYAAPAALVGGVVLYAMSTPKAASGLGLLLPRGRVLLALPPTLWFLGLLTVEAGLWRPLAGRVSARNVLVAIVALCLASSALRLFDFEAREGKWRTEAIALRERGVATYGYLDRATVVRSCRQDLEDARRYDVGLIVYADRSPDRVAAYACASLSPTVETVTPTYERRTWLLYRELSRRRTRVLIADVDASWCDLAAQRSDCSWSNGRALLTFPAQPVLPLLRSLGMVIRGFGPHCRPAVSYLVYCHGTDVDLTRRPFGPPPRQPDVASREIRGAFTTMFARHDGHITPGAVEQGAAYQDVIRTLDQLPGNPPAVEVNAVTFLDDHEAVVHYRVGGKSLVGEAVVEDGRWRVSVPAFCAAIIESFAERQQIYPCDTGRFS